VVVSYIYFRAEQNHYKKITSFDSCVAAGFFVTPTYPEKCTAPGKIFINETQKEQKVIDTEATARIEDSFKNLSYIVDGQKIAFYDGVGVLPASTSFKNTATATLEITFSQGSFDINKDFSPDLIILIKKHDERKQSSYYLSSTITLNSGYAGLNALYLDADIASSSILYTNDIITIEYSLFTGAKKKKHFIFKHDILEETTIK
jgi:hypothetical protein